MNAYRYIYLTGLAIDAVRYTRDATIALVGVAVLKSASVAFPRAARWTHEALSVDWRAR